MTCIIFDPSVTIPEPIAWRHAPTIEDIRDALKAPVPHAAEVSAVVARLWHLGLAEDADRRQKHWINAALLARLRRDRDLRAEAMSDYFADLADAHRMEAS